jgi:phenylalanine-4-hydroxylase
MARHPLTEKIPEYLMPYVATQDASLYTAIDHESWRFILKIARAFFAQHAHQKYLDGLRETGISTERIPLISEMDERLRRFHWRAVPVSGFIPPAVFMEFLSLGVLPIACDMRQLEHLAYTPAPDIVHEAAGHAPIIADPDFADYLRHYGLVAEKAIYTRQDHNVYEAVRHLSIVKEDPHSTAQDVQAAQKRLDDALAAVDHVSEATQLSRMGWWTFEYGLIGSIENPKIYGAGLLSSVGESYHCLSPSVRKVPFSMDCVNVNFDITKPQPQLFVAKDFHTLTGALDELAKTMAFKLGGEEGLKRAKKAEMVCTVELDTGIQVSGIVAEYRTDERGNVAFIKTSGATQLAFAGRELAGQGTTAHAQGFSAPVGKLAQSGRCVSSLSDAELRAMGFLGDQSGRLTYESGITLEGRLKKVTREGGKNIVLTFESCTIRHEIENGAETLYRPEWGLFDLTCGASVASVFGGAADRRAYLSSTGGFSQEPSQQKTNLTEGNRALNQLYARLREARDSRHEGAQLPDKLAAIHLELESLDCTDWLLRFGLLESLKKHGLHADWEATLRARLEEVSRTSSEKAELIARGLSVLESAGVV